MIWPRSRSAVQGIGLLGATLYWYWCAKIRSGSGAANADGMAAKSVGMIWPRSRSAMQGIGLLSGIWILVCSNQKCNWSSVCTRNVSIGTWSMGKPISMQQVTHFCGTAGNYCGSFITTTRTVCKSGGGMRTCTATRDEGSSFSCGMSMCSNPIASNSSSEMGMAGSTFMCLFCMSPA